jgi:flagellar basal body-associated protein FliL
MAEEPSSVSGRTIGILVVVGLVALAAGLVWYFVTQPKNTVAPEEAARAWAEKLKLPYRGAACTMFDSDGDGYVSCVVALDGPDKVYFQGLQCGELNSRKGGGCKPDAKNPEVNLVIQVPTKPAASAQEPR